MPSIEISDLTKVFGSEAAVDGLGLHVAEGELLCLLGPSGCGKTTTLRCIAGLETPTSGRISIGARTVTDTTQHIDIAPARRNIGMVFQSYAIWPHLSVGENIAYPLRRRKVGRAQRKDRIERALAAVGLAGFEDRRATALSGGQQQRVALARAIVSNPDVLLFDEPLSNLDARLRQTVREEIKRTHDALGTASVYVTHDQVEALALADTVVVMDHGRVVQHGLPEVVFTRPVNRFVADFVGVDNILSGTCVEAVDTTAAIDVPQLGRLRSIGTLTPPKCGESVDVAIRALDLRLCHPGTSVGNRVTGTVMKVTYLGEFLEVALDANGTRILARWRHHESDLFLAAGTKVSLAVAPELVHVMSRHTNPSGGSNANTKAMDAAPVR